MEFLCFLPMLGPKMNNHFIFLSFLSKTFTHLKKKRVKNFIFFKKLGEYVFWSRKKALSFYVSEILQKQMFNVSTFIVCLGKGATKFPLIYFFVFIFKQQLRKECLDALLDRLALLIANSQDHGPKSTMKRLLKNKKAGTIPFLQFYATWDIRACGNSLEDYNFTMQ